MIKNKKKKKCEFSFKTSLKNTVRSIESREKFSRKTRIRRALYEEYRIGWKHVRSEGRENLLWNHAVTNPAQQRITQLYPLLPLNPRWHDAQPVSPPIDGDNRDTQCRRDVPSTRPSSCREDERGILNSRRGWERRDIAGGETRRKKEERNPWERAVYKPYPRLLRLPREIPRETFTSCWLVARSWPSSSIQPSLQATHQYDFPECYAKWIVWSSRGRG